MSLYVRAPSGAVFSFDTEAIVSCTDLKQTIEHLTGAPADRQQLTLLGKELEDENIGIAIARAAARDARFSPLEMLALARCSGASAVYDRLALIQTLDLRVERRGEYVLRHRQLRGHVGCKFESCGVSISTAAASSECDSESLCSSARSANGHTFGAADDRGLSGLESADPMSAPSYSLAGSQTADLSLASLAALNRMKAASLRNLIAQRRLATLP